MSNKQEIHLNTPVELFVFAVIILVLHLSGRYSYLLFHELVESARIVVLFSIFALAWHSRHWAKNSYLVFVGISYLFVGSLEVLHSLAYNGMNVFPHSGANLATQLWIALRYLESASLLVAALLIEKRLQPLAIVAVYVIVTVGLGLSIFLGAFPDCFIDGKGLTAFKVTSEYAIAAAFLATIIPLTWKKRAFDREVLGTLVLSLIAAAGTEIAFTGYAGVYDRTNEMGHYLLLFSSACVYRAVLVTGLVNPYSLLFRDLKQREDELEARVTERTAALAQSEERFRLLVEQAPDAIIVYDADLTRIIHANANAERLFGCRRDELLKHGQKHFDPAPQPNEHRAAVSFQEYVRRALAGKTEVFERVIRSAAGKEVICEVRLNRLPEADRKLIRASFIDISERKRAENALRESEARLELQFDLMPIACITWDREFKAMSWNPAAEKIFGFTAGEAIGKHPYEYIVPKDAQPDVDAVWSRLIRGDATVHSVNENVTKDGRTIICDWTNTPLKAPGGEVVGVLAMAQDITVRKRAETALAQTNRALRTVSRCNEVLVHATSEQELLQAMCQILVEDGGYILAWVGVAEQDEAKTVRPVAWAGREAGFLETARITWADTERGQGPTGTAIRSGQPQINHDFATDPRLAPWRRDALERGYGSSMALPLKSDTEVFGSFTIYAAGPQAFTAEEVKLLIELANDTSYGIRTLRIRAEHETSAKRIRDGLQATVEALAGMVELRDPYTAGHQRNVSKLASAIARDMGLTEHDIEGIRIAGVVHDIGKIQVPAEILSKPGKLTKVEFELIKAHAQAGYEIIKGVNFLWPVPQMILQHHERLNGSGYPNGLRGDAIIVGARILAVADVVEAMTARRPYREALGLDAALAEIEAGRGVLYDPAAVDSCCSLFRDKKFGF